jgi:MFS family permease
VAPDGRLISYRVAPSGDPQASEADARRAAEEELRLRLGADRAGFTLTSTGTQRHETTASEVRRFTFRREYSRELAIEAAVETSGTKPIGFSLTPRIAPEHSKRFPELGKTFNTVRGVTIILLVLGGLVYVIARFVRRLREQEIPLKRTLIVAAIVFFAFGFSSFVGGQSQRMNALEQGAATRAGIDMVMLIVVSTVMAALVGVTWGACEADLREAYPEKLTSIDALLGGLFSSRAVRTSLAVGLTLAAYAILVSSLEPALRSAFGGWSTIAEGELFPYQSAYPGLIVLLYAFTGVPVTMALLLSVVSITHRKGRTRKRQIALALLVLAFFLLGTLSNHTPMIWSVVQAVVLVAILLVPFFVKDVLTAIVTSIVSTWAAASATLLAQPAAIFRSAGWTTIAALIAILGAGAIATFRRRETVVEAERPEYARNIAERLMLKTEMDAARQAQLRVMPRVVPAVEGVRLAATQSPAAEIGSDYYEFFPAADHVSVAVADSRMPGLSSALCVSMLKGLLLNYAARLDDPRDVADRVYRQLSAIFGDDLPVSFFFGRFVRATGAFTFATFGPAPHALVLREGTATSLEGEEYAELTNDDTIVIYTARLAEMQDRDGAPLGDEAIERELASAERSRVTDALNDLAARQSRGVETPQSWSAVAIALDEVRS